VKIENVVLAKEIKVLNKDHHAAMMAKNLEIEELKELEVENGKLQQRIDQQNLLKDSEIKVWEDKVRATNSRMNNI
jgi:hypothetical protein